jgi:tetratricopeptide (TPR) repeat protein
VALFNPFPGLRPFEPDEEHLFFGREKEIDDLLRRLRTTRFLAIVGTSGSGKSSLVRSGLIPSLQSGFMAGAGSSWRIAMMRPGEDPIGHLAAALDAPAVLGREGELPEMADTNRVLLEVTLRRSSRGLVEAVRQARLPTHDNILIIVDQFEELFRFRHSHQIANSRDEAIALVKLLLEAAAQQQSPIYVALTMRSDFIGDCMDFPGLPEAVNSGLYLVGRMSREGLRAALTGPVAVAGGAITPRLVNRILNDLGDDQDQLPLVQHALMRTWDCWAAHGEGQTIDLADYEKVGTIRDALSKHAEEAYQDTVAIGHATTAARVFKALTDTFSDPRGVRRPTAVSALAAVCETSPENVIAVVEIFRRPGRSFLMPPAAVPLTARSIIDISHESLMRCWTRLITWAEEERASAAFYTRLAQAALWYEEGSAGLWRDPELELAQAWRTQNDPTAAWARRYHEGFDRAIAFLDRSVEERDRQRAERELERRAKLRRTQLVAGVLATLLVVAIGLGLFAWSERQRAQGNLDLARQAVDESLAAIDREPADIGADVPQVDELRRQLLARAEGFYVAFMDQEPRSERARRDLALAHLRLGHINRMLEKRDEAEREYREAIARLTALVSGRAPASTDHQSLGTAFNWLGETLRVQAGRHEDAAAAYGRALDLQQALVAAHPENVVYQVERARTLSNRGILRSFSDSALAERDFRESIRLLEPLTGQSDRALQDLGRAANNLAAALDASGAAEAGIFYERAVGGHEQLIARDPNHRVYQLELATFANNFAVFLHRHGDLEAANRRSRQAIDLITALARPAPSLAIERADAHTLRGMILEARDAAESDEAYARALALFGEIQSAPAVLRMPLFHERFGDLLVNLALRARVPGQDLSGKLLSRAVDQYAAIGRQILTSGAVSEIRVVVDTIEGVVPELGDRDRLRLAALQEELRRALTARGPS